MSDLVLTNGRSSRMMPLQKFVIPSKLVMADPTPADRGRIHSLPLVPLPERDHGDVRLPVPLTSFVGREREIASLVEVLGRPGVRLVTLLGPGGVGKTRLAIRVAESVADDFPDGIWFVELAPVRDPALVVVTIAHTLGLRETPERSADEAIGEYLRGRRALLALDNFEHVLGAGPALVALLTECSDLTILVTSRSVLRLSGEHDIVVPPLDGGGSASLPPADLLDSEAVRLFVERARAVRGDLEPAANAVTIAEICRRLDGLPLAIELAAARTRHLPPPALLGRLERRLPLLTGGPRDAPARQHTLRDTIAWSHDLLSPEEQRLFRQMAVFVGGFDLEAANAVRGGWGLGVGGWGPDARQADFPQPPTASSQPQSFVLDGLGVLTDHCLIVPMEGPGGAARWTMLETIREFAAEQLVAVGEEAAVRDRHLAWCLVTVDGAWPPRAPGPVGDWALPRLDAERDNLRAGLSWAIDRRVADAALRVAGGLAEYWYLRGNFVEARGWLARALGLPSGTPRLRASALYGAGILATAQGDLSAARAFAEEGVTLAEAYGDRTDLLRAWWGLSLLESRRFDAARQATHAEAAAALAREVGDDDWLGYALFQWGEAIRTQGDTRRAIELLEEALRLFAGVGDRWGEMNAALALAVAVYLTGEPARAAPRFRQGVAQARFISSPWGIAQGLVGLAAVAVAEGRPTEAARLLGAAEAVRAPMDYRFVRDILELHDTAHASARTRLGEVEFNAVWAAGRALSLEEAIATAAEIGRSESPTAGDAVTTLGLTRREAEVLRLVADGKSDREIAAALHLSYRTITSHITSILTKLGVDSRTAAATYAVRHGLA